jgi:lysozyme family protein
MQKNYDEALKRVLVHEGGYTNHPDDPGGPTNWGITVWDARKYWKRDAGADDVRAMPLEVARRIYKSKYWDAMRCDELPSGVDYAVFDFGVNSGLSRALKFLEDIAGVPQTGNPDDVLIRTVKYLPAKPIVAKLCDKRLAFLKGLKTWPVFGNGWGRRVAEVRAAALGMADARDPAVLPPGMPMRRDEPKGKSAAPATKQKPAVQSTTIWAQIATVATALGGALTDWRALAVIIVAALAAYVIWERAKRPDISGVFRSCGL